MKRFSQSHELCFKNTFHGWFLPEWMKVVLSTEQSVRGLWGRVSPPLWAILIVTMGGLAGQRWACSESQGAVGWVGSLATWAWYGHTLSCTSGEWHGILLHHQWLGVEPGRVDFVSPEPIFAGPHAQVKGISHWGMEASGSLGLAAGTLCLKAPGSVTHWGGPLHWSGGSCWTTRWREMAENGVIFMLWIPWCFPSGELKKQPVKLGV